MCHYVTVMLSVKVSKKFVFVVTANPTTEFHLRCHTTNTDVLSALRLKQGKTLKVNSSTFHSECRMYSINSYFVTACVSALCVWPATCGHRCYVCVSAISPILLVEPQRHHYC